MSHFNYEVLGGRSSYEILGEEIVREVTGAAPGPGFDTSFLVSTAAEAASRGISTYEQKKAAEAASRDAKSKLDRSILADIAWADAEAGLVYAAKTGDPTKVAAGEALVQVTRSEALAAGAALTPALAEKRVSAARKSLAEAARDSSAAPSDASKASRVSGWQKVLAAASQQALPVQSEVPGQISRSGTSSFLTKMHYGVPAWGWAAGGVLVLTGLYLALRRR